MKISAAIKFLQWICAFALWGLTGCSIVVNQFGHVPEAIHDPKSYHDVLAGAGAPDSLGYTDDGFVFFYQSIRIVEPQIGISMPFTDWFKISYGRAEAHQKILWYSFSNDGELLATGKKEWSNKLGGGSGIGMIFVVAEAVDITRFEDIPAQLQWGKYLLLPQFMDEFSQRDIISGKRIDNAGQSVLE